MCKKLSLLASSFSGLCVYNIQQEIKLFKKCYTKVPIKKEGKRKVIFKNYAD